MGAEDQQRAKVCWHCVLGRVAGDNLLQPGPLLWDRLVHSPTQPFLDVLEFRHHAVTSGLPMNKELSLA